MLGRFLGMLAVASGIAGVSAAGLEALHPATPRAKVKRAGQPKRKKPPAKAKPHPAMPADGWPETRQQRRARERAESKRYK